MARALGDGDGKNYGVTADPQFIGWKLRPGQDFALILASDGVWNALGESLVSRAGCGAARGEGADARW